MFHVEQFDFNTSFHVERKSLKTYYLVGIWLVFTDEKIIFALSPCKF